VEKGVQESEVREDANQENLESCYRSQEDIQTMKEKDLPIIKEQKGRSPEIHGRSIEERVYQTLTIISNITSVLCREKGW